MDSRANEPFFYVKCTLWPVEKIRGIRYTLTKQCKTYLNAGGNCHGFASLLSPQCVGHSRELEMKSQGSPGQLQMTGANFELEINAFLVMGLCLFLPLH